MTWVYLVLIGAAANALVNLGYKLLGGKVDVVLAASGAMLVSAITLFIYATWWRQSSPLSLLPAEVSGKVILIGLGAAGVMVFFVTALTKGPISLVDPLWACVYALTSVLIGMALLAEAPSAMALTGIGLYILGAVLMARG